MCVIIIDPAGKDLDFDIIKLGIDRNPDGWGLAYAKDGDIFVTRGFGFKGAKRAWIRAKGYGRVFHARVGTHGTKTIENCHPFNASTKGDKRVFFHNGTVSIPRFDQKMCDSWHVAQLLQHFETNEETFKHIGKYAEDQHSRFVLMTTTQINWWGKGWLQRDGVFYSNASCLAEKKSWAQNSVKYEGGALEDKEVEITCPEHVTGWGYDADRKVYSSTKPSIAVASAANRFPSSDEHLHPGCRYDWNRATWVDKISSKPEFQVLKEALEKKAAGLSTGPAEGEKKESPLDRAVPMTEANAKRLRSELNDEWTKTLQDALIKAPWMTNVQGATGLKKSWPEDKDFLNVKHHFGHQQTYRVFLPKSSRWRECSYNEESGEYIGVADCEGPYANGLIVETGNKFCEWKGKIITFNFWKQMMLIRASKFIDQESVEHEEESEESLPFGVRQELQDALAQEKTKQDGGGILSDLPSAGGKIKSILSAIQNGQNVYRIIKEDGTVFTVHRESMFDETC